MFVLKYICAIIAIFSSLLFFSNLVTNLTSPQTIISKDDETIDNNLNFAAFRLILALIMSITWPLVFLL